MYYFYRNVIKIECDVGTQYGIHTYGLHHDSLISFEMNMSLDKIVMNV
jgi:hypothetical protein